MIGYTLTNDNYDLLKSIFYFGGYIRVSHLKFLYPDVSFTNQYRKLDRLEKMGYLTSRRLKTNSKQEEKTYQVTKSTCRLFFNPDSYFRKKHKPEYIYRALIKSYFLCSMRPYLDDLILADHEDKEEIFKRGNFNQELFPRKYNKDTSFIHFEETILDFTKNNGKIIKYNDNILFKDNSNSLIVVYVDQYFKDVRNQLNSLINKYINLIKSNGSYNINFLIVVDQDNRYKFYMKAIEKASLGNITKDKISTELINVYKDFKLKVLENDLNSTKIFLNDYKNGKIKDSIILKSNNMVVPIDNGIKNIINSVKLKGIVFVKEYVLEQIKIKGSFINADADCEEFFNLLFYLEYNNIVSFSNSFKKLFDVNVFKIDRKFYE